MTARKYKHRKDIRLFAQKLLRRKPVYLDLETSGMDERAEAVEAAVLDSDGSVLLNTLLKPTQPIPWTAQQVHGIDNDDVRDAPSLADIWDELYALYKDRVLIIFNSAFILRMLAQSARPYAIFPERPEEVYCAMLTYAEFYGAWDEYREAYVWQRLDEAVQQCRLRNAEGLRLHRAAADCEATRLLMQHMAAAKKSN